MATSPNPVGTPSPVRAAIGAEVAARLAVAPGGKQAKTPAAQMFVFRDWLAPDECGFLIDRIEANNQPSSLLSSTLDPNFRTSHSCNLDRWDPHIQAIDERIADLLGIEYAYGETIQGQRYRPGQQFRAHHDFFHETEHYWPTMVEQGGQRTWTAMVYLNDVAAGGATWFPQAGVRFNPRRGTLLAWNNMGPDGSPNLATLHEGMAVLEGTKYIITKWFRESPWIK